MARKKKSINQKGGVNFTGRNYYSVIGVKQSDTDKVIKKAYRKNALKIHPDRHPGQETKYEELFKELQHAYEVLKEYRQHYNNYINHPNIYPSAYHPPQKPFEKTPPKPKPKPKSPKPKPKSKPKPRTPPKPKPKPKPKSPPKSKPKSKSPPKSRYNLNQKNMKKIIDNDRLNEFKVHVMEGLNINSKIGNIENSLLMYAITRKAAKIGKFLVESGANVNQKNAFNDTALIEAASSGYSKIVKFLLKRGAKPNIKNDMGENALYKAVVGHNTTKFTDKEEKAKYISIIKRLFEYLSPVNIIPIQSKHLVYHIINTERHDIFKLAIIEGIKQDLQVLKFLLNRIKQAEDLPEQKDFILMLKILLKTGLKPKNLLHTSPNIEVAKLLIAAGDKPTSFYDNKKFISKQVKNFIYPPSPKKKTPKRKSPPLPQNLNKSPFNYENFKKKKRAERAKGKKSLFEKMGL